MLKRVWAGALKWSADSPPLRDLSSVRLEQLAHNQSVTGSNPVGPTQLPRQFRQPDPLRAKHELDHAHKHPRLGISFPDSRHSHSDRRHPQHPIWATNWAEHGAFHACLAVFGHPRDRLDHQTHYKARRLQGNMPRRQGLYLWRIQLQPTHNLPIMWRKPPRNRGRDTKLKKTAIWGALVGRNCPHGTVALSSEQSSSLLTYAPLV